MILGILNIKYYGDYKMLEYSFGNEKYDPVFKKDIEQKLWSFARKQSLSVSHK